jgi:hypothetical protein
MLLEKKLVLSELSQIASHDGTFVEIEIYRLEDENVWTLEVVDETNASTVWDNTYPTEQAALDEALRVINEEGIRSFMKPDMH